MNSVSLACNNLPWRTVPHLELPGKKSDILLLKEQIASQFHLDLVPVCDRSAAK